MSELRVAPRGPADWLALATACLFAINGAGLAVNNETTVLRLAVLGWPGWTAILIAGVHLGLASLLVTTSTRFYGALGLVVVAAVTLGAHVAYREPGAAVLAGGQLVVVLAVLLTARRRPA